MYVNVILKKHLKVLCVPSNGGISITTHTVTPKELTSYRRVTHYCVVEDLNRLKTLLYACRTEETFLHDFR